MPKIGIATIHGIGEQNGDFAEAFHNELRGYFSTEVHEKTDGLIEQAGEHLITKSIYWAPPSSARQDEFFNRCLQTGLIENDTFHNFFVRYAGDLIAYFGSKTDGRALEAGDPRNDFYSKVHDLISKVIKDLQEEVGEDGHISIAAHSMGTIMISDWLKYRKNGQPIQNVFFFGAPVAVVKSGYADYGDPGCKVAGVFQNYVERHDPVSYPLRKTLNEKWDKLTEDVEVNVGGALTSWNAASHLQYWTDNDVTLPVARVLAKQYIGLLNEQNKAKE